MVCTEYRFRLSCPCSRWLGGASESTWDCAGRLWLLKNSCRKPTPKSWTKPQGYFLKIFSLIWNSNFPSWDHLCYRALYRQGPGKQRFVLSCISKERMSVWWFQVKLVCFCLIWWRNSSFTSLWELCCGLSLPSLAASRIFANKAFVLLCWSTAEFNLILLLQFSPYWEMEC